MKFNTHLILICNLLCGSILLSCNSSSGDKKSSTGVLEITTDQTITSGSYASTNSDQNAILVNGKITANLSNITINKTGDTTNSDNSSFYGINSGLLAKGGASVNLSNLNVTTNAKGGNGVFAYGGKSSTGSTDTGDGTNITITNSTINTSLSNSGGVMVAGHASLTANNCTVNTEGNSSAAIRSDKGGNLMNINGGSYTSNGTGSPSIYATADIYVNDANLKSNHSAGIIVEGSNNVTLNNVTLEDTNDKSNKSKTFKNIFLYKSSSGDASSGVDSFTSTNSTIKTHYGDDICVTNQTSNITLTNNTFTNDYTGTKYFLRASADSWGKSGSNGGNVTLKFNNQNVNGDIYIDSISTLNWSLDNNSTFEGAINSDNIAKSLTINATSGCKIKLTNNSYLTETPDETTLNLIGVNGYKLYKSDNTVIKE